MRFINDGAGDGEGILIITTSSGSVPNNFIFIGFGGSLPMNIPHFSHVFNQLNLIFVALHGPTNKTQSESGGGFYYFWDSVPSRIILLSSSSSILQRLLWRWRCCSPRGGFVIERSGIRFRLRIFRHFSN